MAVTARMASTTSATVLQQHDWVSSKGFSGSMSRLPKLVRSTQLRICKKILEVPIEISQTKVKQFSPVASTYVRKIPKQAAEDMRSTSDTYTAESSSGREISAKLQFRKQSVQAVVTVMRKLKTFRPTPNEDMLDTVDAIGDQLGLISIDLQLVSDEIDPQTGTGKRSAVSRIGDWLEKANVKADKVQYTAQFELTWDFGTPGAIIVQNKHQNEFYLDFITLFYSPGRSKDVYFPCHSWIQPTRLNLPERIFFSNKAYLPSETPRGLTELRTRELKSLRGDGKGIRQHCERIYDYEIYNDLGDPEVRLTRPILGGNTDLPYPRRCRTGRPPAKSDPAYESRTGVGGKIYVPRDECFDPIKEASFIDNCLKGLLHKLAALTETNLAQGLQFNSFKDIDRLYSSVSAVATLPNQRVRESGAFQNVSSAGGLQSGIEFVKGLGDLIGQLPFMERSLAESGNPLNINYPIPELVSKDRFAWMRDEEFSRQLLAGQNPSTLECLKIFPPESELDPALYGPQKSAITTDHLKCQLDGLTVEQALDEKKLFIVDYHDLFMPFLNAINSLEGRKSYASRTVLFLTKDGILRPVAIELSLPPGTNGCPGSQRVFTPGGEHTNYWLWTLAKTHVCSNDTGHHQLSSHWLRTHAATEPYVIATHRHLSVMHPIAKLLRPHFRYTLEINSAARQNLISADGVIELNLRTSDADPITKMIFKVIGNLSLEYYFTPGKHCMEMSSAIYKKLWKFDMEALPADLIRRGMAEEDETAPHGLKLTIEDYPFAADGLMLWSAMETWVSDYVSIYYKDSATIIGDIELQTWWAEIRLVGHADKKHEPWWPRLDTKEDLIFILTTMIWMTSGYHAAVNFGQFAYSGYVPNRPSLTRRLIPEEHEPEFQELVQNPHSFFLSTIPSQEQATVMMMIIEALSAHSPDEEYLGERKPRWTSDEEALQAFQKFTSMMMKVEKEIESRNRNPRNKNRNGAGIPPYELLIPRSGPGITGRGVPNSVSI